MCDTMRAMSAETLCQQCSLCCDGALFTRVPIGADEIVPEAVRLATTPAGGRFLPQPCAALSARRCTVYASRPLACRRFECLLLPALREGETTLEGALELVRRAQALLVAARAEGTRESKARAEAFLRFNFGRY